eukprot:m.147342 g.147342  ORF g.147342 m.147342 type:complete len:364 (+) comp16826_c0_seq1:36-1127(+)
MSEERELQMILGKWSCAACTYLNEEDDIADSSAGAAGIAGLRMCAMCGTPSAGSQRTVDTAPPAAAAAGSASTDRFKRMQAVASRSSKFALFNLVESGLCTAQELDTWFGELMARARWTEIETWRGATRMVDDWIFTDNTRPQSPQLPAHLGFMHALMQMVMQLAQAQTPADPVLPLQCFLCYYRTNSDTCPAHTHHCRQITLSLGGARTLTVEGSPVRLSHGDILVLNGENHSVQPERGAAAAAAVSERISINFFFATRSDFEAARAGTRPTVSVNGSKRAQMQMTGGNGGRRAVGRAAATTAAAAAAVAVVPALKPKPDSDKSKASVSSVDKDEDVTIVASTTAATAAGVATDASKRSKAV